MQTGFQNSLCCSNKNVKEKGLAFLGAILVLNNVLFTLNLDNDDDDIGNDDDDDDN